MIRLAILLTLAGLAVSFLAAPGDVVRAHALLARADPPANAQLREPPTQLTLYFTEALERKFSRVRVLDQTGAQVQERVEFDNSDDTLMRVVVKELEPGFVTVAWENVSAVDGHRITGSYPLTILNPDGSVPAGSPPSAGSRTSGATSEPERVFVKAFLLIAGSLLTGALAFVFFVAPVIAGPAAARARRALWLRAAATAGVALVLLLAFGALDLVLQAADINTDIGTVLDTRWGGRWALRNLSLLLPSLALIAMAAGGLGRNRFVPAAGLLGALAYLALTSSVAHAAAGEGAFWSTAADFVHLVAASVWIGMLAQVVMLFVWARGLEGEQRYPVLTGVLRRFSAVATFSVALLLFTGTASAVIEVAQLSDLLESGYGRALLAKLLLLVPLLVIGGVNAYVLRPDFDDATEITGLRNRGAILEDLEGQLSRLVRWELALAVGVLAIVGLLSQTTPTRGRVDTGQTAGKFVATSDTDEVGVTLVVDPNQPGQNTFEVYLTGAVETVERVRLDFQPAGRPDEEARLILDASNPPTFYVGQGAFLSQPGKWRIAVDLRRTRGSDLNIPFDLQVIAPGGQAVTSTGGDFANPISFDAFSVILLIGTGCLAIALVVGGAPRPGLPAGYLGDFAGVIADRVSLAGVRPAWSLAVLIFVGVGLGLLLGSHIDGKPLSRQRAAQGNPVLSSPESIARGQMLFTQNCVICHGESGTGDGPAAAGLRLQPANLYDHVPYHPDQFFFGVITNGVGGVMPSFKATLSEEDRWNILNFLRERFGEPPAVQ